MNKIVLIYPYSKDSFFWTNVEKRNMIPSLTVKEVMSKYQGFEGVLKDIYDVENNDVDLKVVYELFQDASKQDGSKILYVAESSEVQVSDLPVNALKVGYDVGICMEECIFSSIINEVVFGFFPELVDFKDVLNENFLFPDEKTAQDYVLKHNELEAQGKGVEDHMSMTVYEIWRL